MMFSLQDGRLSRLWEIGSYLDRQDRVHGLLAPPFWARNPLFYGCMYDGDGDALRLIEEAGSRMMVELPLPWIERRAIPVGSHLWVADEDWAETWIVHPGQAMTLSPSGKLFHNPFFSDAPGVPVQEAESSA